MLVIQCKALGSKDPIVDDWSVEPPREAFDGGRVTLRQLIERVVRAEVAGYARRREERRFLRVLSEREIASAAARGKVASGDESHAPPADAERAVATALIGYADGLYRVLIDGVEARELDAAVIVTPTSRLTFLRLTLLAGG